MSKDQPFADDTAVEEWIAATLPAVRSSKRQARRWDARGAFLRLGAKGLAAWVLRARRSDGKVVEELIGHWPHTRLDAARAKAVEWTAALKSGVDPAQEQREARHAKLAADQAAKRQRRAAKLEAKERSAKTFEKVAAQFFEKHAKRLRPSTCAEYRRTLGIDNPAESPIAKIRGKSIDEVTPHDIRAIVEAANERGEARYRARHPDYPANKPLPDGIGVGANRTRAYLSALFGWAREHLITTNNPVTAVARPATETKRKRALSPAEIARVWRAVDELDVANKGWLFATPIKLLLLLGQRRDEVGEMRWDELQLDAVVPTWVLPAERAKTKRANTLPLPPQAVALLKARKEIADARDAKRAEDGLPPCEFVFSKTGSTPISGWSAAKRDLDAQIAKTGPLVGGRWRLHDLRRTARTRLAAIGIPIDVSRAILNHGFGTIDDVYDVYDRVPEKTTALARWADELDRIVTGAAAPNVLPFAKQAAT
jgi:integrase